MLEKSWQNLLESEVQKTSFLKLSEFLQSEIKLGKKIYPPLEDVFAAFFLTPFDSVKVVIVGQDPYHSAGQAEGLSFSVKPGVKIPPSLKNIYKELVSDVGIKMPTHGSLVRWAEQGVLLLNTTLTVEEGKPKSHCGRGWEEFTHKVVELLSSRSDPIIFVLWGKLAEQTCCSVLDKVDHPHVVLKAAHPSPFSAKKFFGCCHFTIINKCLKKWGKKPIDWRI